LDAPSSLRAETPLLEREPFLEALRGASGLVFVGREAGMGKTALVRAFCAEARTRARVLGIPACYELHAWIWKHNPADQFANWNPNVSCAYG
jgi:hypothetical protein